MQNVAILGASPKKGRYSNQAQKLLVEHGHKVFPISLKNGEIEGVSSYQNIGDIEVAIDTLTVYVRPEHLENYMKAIISAHPGRVILNPGTESEPLKAELESHNIEVIEACTLVMLRTGQF